MAEVAQLLCPLASSTTKLPKCTIPAPPGVANYVPPVLHELVAAAVDNDSPAPARDPACIGDDLLSVVTCTPGPVSHATNAAARVEQTNPCANLAIAAWDMAVSLL